MPISKSSRKPKKGRKFEHSITAIKAYRKALKVFGRRSFVPLQTYFDVSSYNNVMIPLIEDERKKLKTREKKESFDRFIQYNINKFTSVSSYTPEKLKKLKNADFEKLNIQTIPDSQFSKKEIARIGLVFIRVHLDEAIVKEANNLHKKSGYNFIKRIKAFYYGSILKDFSIFSKKDYDTSILPLELGDFDNDFNDWREAMKESKKERNKHYTNKNSDLLE